MTLQGPDDGQTNPYSEPSVEERPCRPNHAFTPYSLIAYRTLAIAALASLPHCTIGFVNADGPLKNLGHTAWMWLPFASVGVALIGGFTFCLVAHRASQLAFVIRAKTFLSRHVLMKSALEEFSLTGLTFILGIGAPFAVIFLAQRIAIR